MSVSVQTLKSYRFTDADKKFLKDNRKEAQQRYKDLSKRHTMTSEDRLRYYS